MPNVGRKTIMMILALAVLLLIVATILIANSLSSKSHESPPYKEAAGAIPIEDTAQPAPPPKVTPKQYYGAGSAVIAIEKPANSLAILKFECPACTGNTMLKVNGAESLLVNEIGAYSGSHIIDIVTGSNTTRATITATGNWTLSLSGLDQALRPDTNGQAKGQGDSVLYLADSITQAAVTNTGEGNFVVRTFPLRGGYSDLAINTIGSYAGTVPIDAPSYAQITSDGSWTISPN